MELSPDSTIPDPQTSSEPRRMRFAALSVIAFGCGLLSCVVAAAIIPDRPSWCAKSLLVVFYVSVPLGMALAFLAVLRKEAPRRLAIAGFCLNGSWFIVLPAYLYVSVTCASANASRTDPTLNPLLTRVYTQYMLTEYPQRGALFCQLVSTLQLFAVRIEAPHLRRLLGEPDHSEPIEGGYRFSYRIRPSPESGWHIV